MSKAPRGPVEVFDHSQLGLSKANLKIVLQCEDRVRALGRRTTEGAFELGEQLAIVAPMVPEGTFGKWAVWISGYSREYAYTFITMATVLKPYRARLIQAGVRKNVMDKLAAAPEHVNEVLAEFETGRPLSGKQVAAIIGGDEKVPEIALPCHGGVAGLRANAKAKQSLVISEFVGNITKIIADIEEALEPVQQGKRVLKGHLADNVEHRARLTRFQLENIALPVELNPANASQSRVIPFQEGSPWREVADLLWTLGGRASWPPDDLATWLSATVLPRLAWSIDDGKKAKRTDGLEKPGL
jgi:hypothetical protein